MKWLPAALDAVAAGEPAVLVTLADAKGSTPREAGAKMLVLPSRIADSIGGGQLEMLAIDAARRMMTNGAASPALMHYSLGPDLGQCCGGAVRMLLEPLSGAHNAWLAEWERRAKLDEPSMLVTERDGAKRWADDGDAAIRIEEQGAGWRVFEPVRRHARPIWLYGAGHVGRALALVLSELPFDVTWLDSRFDGFPEEIPAGIRYRVVPQLAGEVDGAPVDAVHLVMTHSHALDLEICDRILRRGDFAFLGLIGSETKKARFIGQLKALGHGAAALERLVCPIGLSQIPGKQPMAIAVSVAGQVLALPAVESQTKQSTGKRRGAG